MIGTSEQSHEYEFDLSDYQKRKKRKKKRRREV